MTDPTSLVTGVDFATMATKDFEAAAEFYGTRLGLPCSVRYDRFPGAEYETGSLTLSVIQSEAMGLDYHVNRNPIALHVDDVAAARAELESRGVEFAGDTLDTGVCHMAFFFDPDGNGLMLHHRYAPRTA
ncbi:MAG TPA: VOC family protein [Thermoleophilaceae bacterium]|jgi:catechol 2,3-dioxygenase-like lactoylglutathione lyase family enzyme